jgi:hypothetical protein
MTNQLEPGDLAVFIKSLDGLNVGKVVQCVRIDMIHPDYGVIWLVRSKTQDLITEYGGLTDNLHAQQDWLKKILPPPLTLPSQEVAAIK